MNSQQWWRLIEPELQDVHATKQRRFRALCPIHKGTHPGLAIDLDKGDGVWYCYGCKRGGSLRRLALELGWMETEQGPVRMDRLSPPYQYLQVEEGKRVELPVVRFEVGLSRRQYGDDLVTLPTIRLHVPREQKLSEPPYYDSTNLTLIIRVLDAYDSTIEKGFKSAPPEGLAILEATSPERSGPLLLRFTRRGRGRETRYDVRVIGPATKKRRRWPFSWLNR